MTFILETLPVLWLVGVTLGLSALLAWSHRKLRVYEDPRVAQVYEMLPHNNCGACGFPGCQQFAEALVAARAQPAGCTVAGPEDHARIASFLNVEAGAIQKRVARLACAGGIDVAGTMAHYRGMSTCGGAATVAGGGRACLYGCLGLGDCERACTFGAIRMGATGLPEVDVDSCTACGDCVLACPKDLFSIQSVTDRLWVRCRSHLAGDEVLEGCQVGCTACGKCAVDVGPSVITMAENLPRVNYATLREEHRRAIERCPTGAIVWLEGERVILGHEAAGSGRGPLLRGSVGLQS